MLISQLIVFLICNYWFKFINKVNLLEVILPTIVILKFLLFSFYKQSFYIIFWSSLLDFFFNFIKSIHSNFLWAHLFLWWINFSLKILSIEYLLLLWVKYVDIFSISEILSEFMNGNYHIWRQYLITKSINFSLHSFSIHKRDIIMSLWKR